MELLIKKYSVILFSIVFLFWNINVYYCARGGGGRGGGGGSRVGGGRSSGGSSRGGGGFGGIFGGSRSSGTGVGSGVYGGSRAGSFGSSGTRFSSGTRTWTNVAAGLFAYNIMSRMAPRNYYYYGGSHNNYRSSSSYTSSGYYCTNKEDFNGTVFDKFKCPLEGFPSDYKYCCGPTNYQYCCKFFDDTGRLIGIIFAILAFIGIIICSIACIIKIKKRSNGFMKSSSNSNIRPPPFRPSHPPQGPFYQSPPPPPPPFRPSHPPQGPFYPPPPPQVPPQNFGEPQPFVPRQMYPISNAPEVMNNTPAPYPMPRTNIETSNQYTINSNQNPLLPYPQNEAMPYPAVNNYYKNSDAPPGYSDIVKLQNQDEKEPFLKK